jgi:hypothetical protein
MFLNYYSEIEGQKKRAYNQNARIEGGTTVQSTWQQDAVLVLTNPKQHTFFYFLYLIFKK